MKNKIINITFWIWSLMDFWWPVVLLMFLAFLLAPGYVIFLMLMSLSISVSIIYFNNKRIANKLKQHVKSWLDMRPRFSDDE